jgi:hypothetical protein
MLGSNILLFAPFCNPYTRVRYEETPEVRTETSTIPINRTPQKFVLAARNVSASPGMQFVEDHSVSSVKSRAAKHCNTVNLKTHNKMLKASPSVCQSVWGLSFIYSYWALEKCALLRHSMVLCDAV